MGGFMNYTKEQWEVIKKCATSMYSHVILQCDDYKVHINAVRVSELKLALMVHVNGEFKGIWMDPKKTEFTEIQTRFLRPRFRLLRKTSNLVKLYGKRRINQMNRNLTVVCYDPTWTSFGSLKNHLLKNNKSVVVTGPESLLEELSPAKATIC
jgi:hypothetical protein